MAAPPEAPAILRLDKDVVNRIAAGEVCASAAASPWRARVLAV
jgi:DNA mismatch repair ATPase MutL